MAMILSHAAEHSVDCGFNAATLRPDNPIKCHSSTQRTQAPKGEIQSDRRRPTLTRYRTQLAVGGHLCADRSGTFLVRQGQ